MSLFRPLVRGAAYPYHLAKTTYKGGKLIGKTIMERALTGNWKDVFSDPKNQFTAHFYEYIEGVKSNRIREIFGDNTIKSIVHNRRTLKDLYHAKALLYKAKASPSFS